MNSNSPTEEIWRPVHRAEFAEYYAVSNHGRVMRVKTHSGKPCNRILKHGIDHAYAFVQLCVNGRPKIARVHALVAGAFLGECPDGCEVNHKDTNKLNNHVENLEYLTHKENMEHAKENGLYRRGETHSSSKLTDEQVLEIRANYQHTKHSLKEWAKKYNVHPNVIRFVLTGVSWKHLPSDNDKNLNSSMPFDKVQAIRAMYAEGHKQVEIAHAYNVSISYVSLIVRGKRRTPTPPARTENGAQR